MELTIKWWSGPCSGCCSARRRFLQNWCLRHGNDFMTHSSYLLASPTDGFAKAQLMSQCLPYHPTDLSPYLPYQIGRAPCRERVCQYVYISVAAVQLKKKSKKKITKP